MPKRTIQQSRRLVEHKHVHAANEAKVKTGQLRREELSADLITGFREAMEAAEMKLRTSAVEKAQLLALLKVKDAALQQSKEGEAHARDDKTEHGKPSQALQVVDSTGALPEAEVQIGSPSAQLARLQEWRRQMCAVLRPEIAKLGACRRGGVEEERQAVEAALRAVQVAATAEKETEARLKAEAELVSLQHDSISGTRPGTPGGFGDAELHTKFANQQVELRRVQNENDRLKAAARAADEAQKAALARVNASSTSASTSSAEVTAMKMQFDSQLREKEEDIRRLNRRLEEIRRETQSSMDRLQRDVISKDAELEGIRVELEITQQKLKETELDQQRFQDESMRLQNKLAELQDGQWQPDWDIPEMDNASHDQNYQVAQMHEQTGQGLSDKRGGLMVNSLQDESTRLYFLERLYNSATAQADSARRQAEAATALNEQLVHARTAPHHDANEDARVLIEGLHDRVREQDDFITVAMKRLTILEAFIREERELVVDRATEHVGAKLKESTRRFNIYATKAREHEDYLKKQLQDATAETAKALQESTEIEELRLVAERAAESEKHRKEHARRQLARCYLDGQRRDKLYSTVIGQLQSQILSLQEAVKTAQDAEVAAEQRAMEAEKQVKRLEYNAKMVELERKQENAWDLKINLKAKEEQLRTLAKAATRLQVMIHGPDANKAVFATTDERVDSLVQACTVEAADIRGRELLAFDDERRELQGKVVSSAAEVMRDAREMKAKMDTQLTEQRLIAEQQREDDEATLLATQAEAADRIAKLSEALRECASQLDATRAREDVSERQLLCYRKISHRLVQYIGDKRKLLRDDSSGEAPYGSEEVNDYARYLGIDPTSTHLVWIAEEALHAPLPPHWSSHRDDAGDVYFVSVPCSLLCTRLCADVSLSLLAWYCPGSSTAQSWTRARMSTRLTGTSAHCTRICYRSTLAKIPTSNWRSKHGLHITAARDAPSQPKPREGSFPDFSPRLRAIFAERLAKNARKGAPSVIGAAGAGAPDDLRAPGCGDGMRQKDQRQRRRAVAFRQRPTALKHERK